MSQSTEDKRNQLYLLLEKDSFSSGVELGVFVTSPDLLCSSWKVIMSLYEESNQFQGLSCKLHCESNLTILAFVTTPIFTPQNLQPDLVSSSALRQNNFLSFEFLCAKSNPDPDFSVDKTAISLFHGNRQRLDELKSKINEIINSSAPSPPLVVTGHGLGGSIASLFTLSLLDGISTLENLQKKRPLCITFGSPLVGDKKLQQAVSRSPTWNSCFLHVVSHKDPLPRLFIANHSSQTSAYTPFGTFLLCSDANSTCYENPDSILELLLAISSLHDQGLQSADYGNILENLYRKVICKDSTTPAENLTHSNSLHASIIFQLGALGFATHMQQQQQQNIDINALVTKMETLEAKFINEKRTIFDPSKKLNLEKINMAELEKYKKDSKKRGLGYYDSYKKMLLERDQDAIRHRKELTGYWVKMVEEAEMKPQKEGAAFRTRWLYGGTNYRRMVEPLDIAEYYRDDKNKDYVNEGRSRHYKMLEEWLSKGGTEATSSLNKTSREKVESILTLDSCFWARVEEALLSLKQLKDPKSGVTEKEEARKKLVEFEGYVYGQLKNYAVSPEIFLEHSSYMDWWKRYKTIRGTSHDPALASFMSNPTNYKQYAAGAYNFC